MNIRQANFSDLPYLYEICVKTGFSGKDAGPLLQDPWLIGQYYCAPYLIFEPDCCFVAADSGIPKGYIIGASSTESFNRWMNREWLPELRKKYPVVTNFSSDFEAFLLNRIHNDLDIHQVAEFQDFPSQLHIDLLPDCQGQGLGRSLINRFMESLREKGSTGLHFGVAPDNRGALEFYKKTGFNVLSSSKDVVFMGKRLKKIP